MSSIDLRNTLMTLEWSRRFSFACTLILTVVFFGFTIFLLLRFHIGLFGLVWLGIADFAIVCLLIPVIYHPYKKGFDQKIIPEFIESKSSFLSLDQDKEIDRVDFMASHFFLKTPNAVWCEMVMKGALKNYNIRCGMILINSSEQNRQGGHSENMFFNGLFIIVTPTTLSGRINYKDPSILIAPQSEPYIQDATSLTMAISEDSSRLGFEATKPIPNGSTHSMYSSKIPDQSLCIPPKQIRIVRKKAEQVIYEDSVFNGAFAVYCNDSDSKHKSVDLRFKQLLLKAKERNGKSFYFSKFDNVVFAAFERERNDFNPPFFVPINKKIVDELDNAFQKTLDEIDETIEIAEYLK